LGFDADWLELRAPADATARDPGLLAAAAAYLGGVRAPLAVDLGCGTGATVRAFAPLAPAGLRWRLIDNDPALLALAAERCRPEVETVCLDLAAPESVPLAGARLVTASALFDLVSEDWIGALVGRLAREGVGLYAALTYDGRLEWAPALPADGAVRDAFNAHQRGDKGFGPALGPAAPAALAAACARHGYVVRQAASPWRLGPGEAALQAALVDGIAVAAGEAGFAGAAEWGQARRAASGGSACSVGHIDLLALPPAAKAQSNTTSAPSP
jgi:SAM-dependent methyltransferase